jgi:4-carboxymuconolactone decarboxylase
MASSETPRFRQVTLESLDPGVRPLAEEIVRISRSGLAGPYNALLRSPVLAERTKRLLDYLRFDSSVPLRLNEFAILIQARLWTSQIQWRAHHPLAIKHGLPESVASDLREGRRPRDMRPDEAAVCDFCLELALRYEVCDATYERVRRHLSEQQVVDLVAVFGMYVMVAMVLSVSQSRIPEGEPLPLDPLPDDAPILTSLPVSP